MSDDAGDARSDIAVGRMFLRTAINARRQMPRGVDEGSASVRRRFNQAVLEAVYVKDRKIAQAEFSEVFALSSLARIPISP